MPGPFYFAWVAPEATTFDPETHAVEDESVYAFDLSQEEGDFAKLSLTIRNPRVGLLNPGRNVWAWLSYSPSSGVIEPLFFGRLIGIPTSLFEEICTLEFIARPADYADQKEALAESLRVLPYYDPIFISKDRRTDPDVVLEGYSALYHTDRLSGPISISDVLTGEDGTISFGEDEIITDSVQLNLNNIPLRSVTMEASVPWDQTNQGYVDLTEYIYSNWPNQEAGKRYISTYTPDGIVSGWPDANGGTSVGNGWEGAAGACSIELTTKYETTTVSFSGTTKTKFGTGNEGPYRSGLANAFNDAGDEVSIQDSISTTAINHGDWSGATRGTYPSGAAVTSAEVKPSYDDDHDLTNISSSVEVKRTLFPLGKMTQTLGVTFDQTRAAKEILKFTLNANVQAIVTEPGEGEVLALTISSEKVSDVLDDTVEPENQIIPIGDTTSNTYYGLPRGAQSIEYCIMIARAHLAVRSRVVEIEFETTNLGKVIGASLRKSATISDSRIPGGGATGKIISYTLALDGDDGDFSGKIKIGSAIGYGGAVVEVAGTDDYADDYSSEYTFLVGQQNVLPLGDVGYIVPDTSAAALSWLGQLSWQDVIEEGLTVENPPSVQQAVIDAGGVSLMNTINKAVANQLANTKAESKSLADQITAVPTIMRFTLVSLKDTIGTDIELVVSDLELPQNINLEAS